MKSLVPVLVVVLTASAAFGQFFGYGSGGASNIHGYGSLGGFGNVNYPGTGHPPPVGPIGAFGVVAPIGRPGGPYYGGPVYPGHGPGYSRYNRGGIVPYPVFVGGYYGGYYDGLQPPVQEQQTPQTIVIQQPPQVAQAPASSTPSVVINQYFKSDTTPAEAEHAANAAIRQYQGTGVAGPPVSAAPVQGTSTGTDDKPTIYLIALRDHTIMPALGYWVEGDTLNYITSEGSHNRVSMDLVDKSFSRQLNDERRVEFSLP